jgi:hypothetical protein
MFYNNNGVELGYNEITNDQLGIGINSNEIRDIQRINDTLFITGSFFGPDFSENPVGELIIDTSANVYNFQSHPNTKNAPCLIKASDSNYVIATSIEETKGDDDIYVYKIDKNLNDVPFDPTPYTYDSLCPGGIQSGTIDLTSCFIWTDIGDAPSPKEYYSFIKTIPVKAYPNPVNGGEVTFEFENTEHHRNITLKCFNLMGKQFYETSIITGQQEAGTDVNHWPQGMYLAVVYGDGLVVGRCKFVVQ